LLFHVGKLFGQSVENLVVAEGQRNHVSKLAHEMCGSHLAMKKTRDRITISDLMWPTLTASCKTFTLSYQVCQKRDRVTCFDTVPTHAIHRDPEVFYHWFMDCSVPLYQSQVQ